MSEERSRANTRRRSLRKALDPSREKAAESMPPEEPQGQITLLLRAWSGGNDAAAEELMALTYDRLRRRATAFLARERAGHTLETAALINETYLRLLEQRRIEWRNRNQFMAVAAQMMRRILVNYARERAAEKRGGGVEVLQLDEISQVSGQRLGGILRLDDALKSLSKSRTDLAQVVELRFFGGFSNEEISSFIGISVPTVVRRWRLARACLTMLMSSTP